MTAPRPAWVRWFPPCATLSHRAAKAVAASVLIHSLLLVVLSGLTWWVVPTGASSASPLAGGWIETLLPGDPDGDDDPVGGGGNRQAPIDASPRSIDIVPGCGCGPICTFPGLLVDEPDPQLPEFLAQVGIDGKSGRGAGSGRGEGSGDGDGRGNGSGSGRGKVGFFGAEGQGDRYIFVVDCSKSMYGDRFARARHELSKTLELLSEDQEFYIVFFSDRAIPMFDPRPADEPVKATKLMRGKARRWIVNRGAFGNTQPDEALRMALRMRPDVVYFLTDGEFSPSALDVCREENVNKASIHTIAFCTQKGESLLKAIAAEHNGRYRFVK